MGLPIKRYLEKAFHLPVLVENDVNAMALGEKVWGRGKRVNNLVCLTIGTGIGGGVIINNQIYRGAHFYAGEIGHLMVEPNGPKCKCGSRGCLEALAAAPAIVRRTRVALKESTKPSRLREMVQNYGDQLNPQIIYMAAKRGDRLAREIVQKTAYYIGIALKQVINLLDPEMIIIGGGVALAGETLFKPIRSFVSKHSIPSPLRQFKIMPAQLKERAGVLGSAALVFMQKSVNIFIP